MSCIALTPSSIPSPSSSDFKFQRLNKLITPKFRRASLQSQPITSDPFHLQLAETLQHSLPSSSTTTTPLPLRKIRESSFETLLSFPRTSQILPPSLSTPNSPPSPSRMATSYPQSDTSGIPKDVYVGTLSGLASTVITERVTELVCGFDGGDLFWSINGIGAPDVTVVHVPEECHVENPIHLRYLSVEGGGKGSNSKMMRVSNPRVVVVVGKGAEVDIIEEFSGAEGSESYWTNSAFEAVVGEGAKGLGILIHRLSLRVPHISNGPLFARNHLVVHMSLLR